MECSFAPLPREGHTLTLVENVNISSVVDNQFLGGSYLLLFGGLMREVGKVSNSVHICCVQDIEMCMNGKQQENGNETASRAQKVVWRTLQCTGPAPCGRHKHTATKLHGKSLLIYFSS